MKRLITILLLSVISVTSCTKLLYIKNYFKHDQILLQTKASEISIHEFVNHTLKMNLTFNNLGAKELRLYGIIEPWENAIFYSCFRFDVIEGDIEIDPFLSKVNYMPCKSSYLLLPPNSKKRIELAFEIIRAKKGRAKVIIKSIYNDELQAQFDLVIDKDIDHTKRFCAEPKLEINGVRQHK